MGELVSILAAAVAIGAMVLGNNIWPMVLLLLWYVIRLSWRRPRSRQGK